MRIFTDYYEEIKYTLHPRKTEMENIDKILGCGDPSFGGAMYVCTHCGNFKFVPFRCHSRFCPTCGNKYAMKRTTNMSFNGDTVTFHYNRHEDNKYIVETLPAIDFIKRLIRHIPEKHFKMIRYGGLYARHRKTDEKLYRAISKSKHRICRSFNQWRTAILSSFGYDPLECPNCKHKMDLLELYYNHKRVSLEELYERAMSKSFGKRSSA